MVLLSPLISAFRKLLAICERYEVTHGRKYNATKSTLMMFKAGLKTNVPPVSLNGIMLLQVTNS